MCRVVAGAVYLRIFLLARRADGGWALQVVIAGREWGLCRSGENELGSLHSEPCGY